MKENETDKLSLECRMAKEAGMSYGQWKALQPVVKPKEKEPTGQKRICEFCGEVFYKNDNRPRRFCDVICQKRAYEVKRNERRMRLWAKQECMV